MDNKNYYRLISIINQIEMQSSYIVITPSYAAMNNNNYV